MKRQDKGIRMKQREKASLYQELSLATVKMTLSPQRRHSGTHIHQSLEVLPDIRMNDLSF